MFNQTMFSLEKITTLDSVAIFSLGIQHFQHFHQILQKKNARFIFCENIKKYCCFK